jgi:hypothetical protein
MLRNQLYSSAPDPKRDPFVWTQVPTILAMALIGAI